MCGKVTSKSCGLWVKMTSKSRDSKEKVTSLCHVVQGRIWHINHVVCGRKWDQRHVVYGKENLQNLIILVNLLGQYLTPFFYYWQTMHLESYLTLWFFDKTFVHQHGSTVFIYFCYFNCCIDLRISNTILLRFHIFF